MATFGQGVNPYDSDVACAPAPEDERITAVSHLIVTERERDQARRESERTQKSLAVADEAYYAAQENVRRALGYDNESVAAKSSTGY